MALKTKATQDFVPIKEIRDILADFDREQRAKIRALTDALPANYPLVLENRKRRQRNHRA